MSDTTVCQSDNEVLEDVECFREEEELMIYYGGCQKNPGHKSYTRIADLCLQVLPSRIKDINVLTTIQLCSKLVVRVIVACTSTNRPSTNQFFPFVGTNVRRTASGYIRNVSFPNKCNIYNCQKCLLGKHSNYGEIDIVTNKHVVFDDIEAANTTIELFYDSSDRDNVVLLQGLYLRNCSDFLDVAHLTCKSNDINLIDRLHSCKKKVIKSLANIPRHMKKSGMCVAISHPHGLPKLVSFGDIVDQEIPEYDFTYKIWTWHGQSQKPDNNSSCINSSTSLSSMMISTDVVQNIEGNSQMQYAQDLNNLELATLCESEQSHVHDRSYKKTGQRSVTHESCEVSLLPSSHKLDKSSVDGKRFMCRHVSRYLVATCPGSSGSPVFIQFGSSTQYLDCFVHSSYDRYRKLNVSRRKNVF